MIRAKTALLFLKEAKITTSLGLVLCGKHTHDMCYVVFFILCWFAGLWHFLEVFCSLLLFFINSHSLNVVENLHRLSFLSFWMLILTFKLWNCILGGLHKTYCHFCCDWIFPWNFAGVIPIYCSKHLPILKGWNDFNSIKSINIACWVFNGTQCFLSYWQIS